MLAAIIIHDWGYWGCKSMDGPDGFTHPIRRIIGYGVGKWEDMKWEVYLHSRYLAKEIGLPPSRLCWADKLGTALMPSILWALMAAASGEGWEYMANPHGHDYVDAEPMTIRGLRRFHKKYKALWGRRETRWGDDRDLIRKCIMWGDRSVDGYTNYDNITHRGL